MRVTHSPHPHGDLGLGTILGHTQNLICEIMTADIYKARCSVTVDTLHSQISMQHRLQLKYCNRGQAYHSVHNVTAKIIIIIDRMVDTYNQQYTQF